MQKILDYLNGFLVLIMFLVILVQISARIFLKVSTSWTVDVGVILFVFTVFLGLVSLTLNDIHLRVDVIYGLMNVKLKKVMDIVNYLLILLFLIIFSIGTYRAAINNITVRTPTIEWFKWGYLYFFIFITTLLQILIIVRKIFTSTKDIGTKK